MKYARIKHHANQIAKIRGKLGAADLPVAFIPRPVGMKKYLFERRIKKLAHHEAVMEELIYEGLSRQIESAERRKTSRRKEKKQWDLK